MSLSTTFEKQKPPPQMEDPAVLIGQYKPSVGKNFSLQLIDRLPVLTLSGEPYEIGYTQGIVCGAQIQKIVQLIKSNTLLFPKKENILGLLKQLEQNLIENGMRIYIDELQGLTDGYNKYLEDSDSESSLYLDKYDMLLFNTLADSELFSDEAITGTPCACTVIALYDSEKKIIVGRNLDWTSAGILGNLSLIIVRNENTIDLTFPCMTGSLTAINRSGMFVSINSCFHKNANLKGIPAMIFCRWILENNIDPKLIDGSKTACPFHLTVVTPKTAICMHMRQFGAYTVEYASSDEESCGKKAQKPEDRFCSLSQLGNLDNLIITNGTHGFDDCEPFDELSKSPCKKFSALEFLCSPLSPSKAFPSPLSPTPKTDITSQPPPEEQHPSITNLVELLRNPDVNLPETIHSAIYSPQKGFLILSFSNSFAASKDYVRIDLKALIPHFPA